MLRRSPGTSSSNSCATRGKITRARPGVCDAQPGGGVALSGESGGCGPGAPACDGAARGGVEPNSEGRVSYCPTATGTPNVSQARTALFNWAHPRHTGGKLIFRIEDTDAQRDTEESYQAIIDSLKWLGLDWDEGIETGGPHEPYRQSQRMDIYAEVLEKLKAAGEVYPAYSTPEEVEERHKAAGRDPKLGYDNYDRDLTEEQIAAFEAEGRKPVWRLKMDHDRHYTWTDLVRGEMDVDGKTM